MSLGRRELDDRTGVGRICKWGVRTLVTDPHARQVASVPSMSMSSGGISLPQVGQYSRIEPPLSQVRGVRLGSILYRHDCTIGALAEAGRAEERQF
jgi:hypothetical protein